MARPLSVRVKRLVVRVLRSALVRYVRRPPRSSDSARADRRVVIVLWTAFGMGGTIRAAINLAQYLAERDYDVEIVSGVRERDRAFFGEFPPGVRVSALHDRRPGAAPRGARGLVQRALLRISSALMHKSDRSFRAWSLWTDIQLARKLRGGSGFLIGTRPGVNLMLARLRAPGFVTIGLEQVNISQRSRTIRRSMRRLYRHLDALVVLTDSDVEGYDRLLNGSVPLFRIPNTVRPLPGAKADLGAKTVYAAGRLRNQKGFDLLIPAWAQVVPKHPDWQLRLRGEGHHRGLIEGLIEEHGVAGSVSLEGSAENIGEDMAAASIFVLSSRFEGFPLILLEAMSKGMSVVSFDCPTGPSDIIDDHRNGILVPAEDVDALARGIEEMIADEELRRRSAAAAVETAQEYTMEAIGPRWIALFDDLSRPPRTAPA
ncbi:MAG TPA: glycosyltransferase family 4 protein [Solirubrobacteraceae bacterium]|nr:glycosyltransferase family 4 protein [Solirubrobacteraceae bacterium]